MNSKQKDSNFICRLSPRRTRHPLASPGLILLSLRVVLLTSLLLWSSDGLGCEKVAQVIDGDTILLRNGTQVRYVGIDTPEIDHEAGKSEFMAETAADVNQKWVAGKCVRLEYDLERVDGHGRHLAYVFLPDGRMVNEVLVRKGLAHVMSVPPNLKYRERLLNAQREAMTEATGIWKQLSKSPDTRIGNTRTYRFHRPDCPYGKRTSVRHQVRFNSRFEAFWEGYAPCRRCRP